MIGGTPFKFKVRPVRVSKVTSRDERIALWVATAVAIGTWYIVRGGGKPMLFALIAYIVMRVWLMRRRR